MMTALRSRQSSATSGINLPTFLNERRGVKYRSATRRCFVPQAAAKSKGRTKGGGESFSLRDSETLGNLGVAGVLGTAVVVGGALVIFNPYAGQNIQQTTIETVEVPEPLPVRPEERPIKARSAPPVAAMPKEVTTPKPAPPPVGKPMSPPVSSVTVARPKPVSAVKAASSETSGGNSTSLIGGLVVVAAIGGGAVYLSQNGSTKESVVAEPSAPTPEADTPPDSPAEPTPPPPAIESPGSEVEDARAWIDAWKKRQQ